MAANELTWGGSLHQTFRLLPQEKQSPNLRPFLDADRLKPEELLERLPYDKAKAKDPSREAPDAKRYRDGKQVYQTVGLLYEDGDRIHVTDLGVATRRWLDIVTPKNRVILARHAAYALAACQLRNPTGAGQKYSDAVEVFPFAFIWRAMLSLDGCINSDELNCVLFRVNNEGQLPDCIATIREARDAGDPSMLGEETISDPPAGRSSKNDRIIPWVSLASFGWTLFPDKGPDNYYRLEPGMLALVREASRIKHPHREFSSAPDYVKYVSRCAALPKDLR